MQIATQAMISWLYPEMTAQYGIQNCWMMLYPKLSTGQQLQGVLEMLKIEDIIGDKLVHI